MTQDDPFSDWSEHIHKPVYSIDGKKMGSLRKTISDYIVVQHGFITMRKYIIPTSLAESASKVGIRLRITGYEVRSKYSYSKMQNTVTTFDFLPITTVVDDRPVYDRYLSLRQITTRNKLAAAIALISGLLFILSGYKANIEIYHLIEQEIVIYTPRDFWTLVLAPIGFLALLSQLGGISVLIGAGLFAVNRVYVGKFLVSVGTGQGLLTIGLRILSEIWSAKWSLQNNYLIWLTSSAAGLGILFAVMSQSISKGRGGNIVFKALRFALRIKKR